LADFITNTAGRSIRQGQAAQRLRDLSPDFTISGLIASDFTSLEHRAMLAEGLHLAGLAE
jgi:hypothetical protein